MEETSLVVSSDIIESLFGKFKSILERHPRGEFNRILLTIPCLCGELEEDNVVRSLGSVTHRDLQNWTAKHIPKTNAQKKAEYRKLYRSRKVPKSGNVQLYQTG